MTKRIYLKDESFDPIYKEISKGFYAKSRVLPITLVFTGILVLVTQVFMPILVFKTQNESPYLVSNATVLGRAAGFYTFEFSELEPEQSITYETTEYLPQKNTQIKGLRNTNIPDFFYITIPKLKIKDALVETNADSLDPTHALGHYPGTSLPGENGNSFVFGHSVLPWFFNPSNYKTIFSTLNKLDKNDKFYINFNNTKYTYIVESKEVLSPKDVKPLAEIKPKYLNDSTMVLMTCSPAGTKLKRLLVNAVLID